ncbi:MAG: hypothetical protein ACLPIC_19025 [Rhodoblastus sp.]|uniref:glucosamine inositolphosphorylceramide transferase family protein n=1 Tax=Rhodoblastus sp. TaxID=1962975 RepID=UPI003F9556D7
MWSSLFLNEAAQEAQQITSLNWRAAGPSASKGLPKIEVLLRATASWQWQADLIGHLRSDGYPVSVVASGTEARSWQTGLSLLMALERLVYGGAAIHPATAVSLAAMHQLATADFSGPADFVLDLTGSAVSDSKNIRVLYDGCPCDSAALAAVLNGHAPVISVVCEGRELAHGLPVHSEIVTRALDWTFARSASLIRHVLADLARNGRQDNKPSMAVRDEVAMRSPLAFGAETLAVKVARALTRLSKSPELWRIAWRLMDGDDAVAANLRWPAGGYIPFRDDGKRFFADPFAFEHEGVSYVFCEEFPYATQKGVISFFTISPDGVVSAPRVVIEAGYHLSYPMVFRHQGAIYLMPETADAKTIEIWRAERFPDIWIKHAELLSGFGACDATLTKHDGRLWLFAALLDDSGSSMDALGLFHAEDLFGPWRAHPLNPVLIDVTSARPGGFMLQCGGKLRRIAQDSTQRYGGGLSICDVERLDPEGYNETIAARLPPPPRSNASGVHTLNTAGRIEVIDLFGPRGAF